MRFSIVPHSRLWFSVSGALAALAAVLLIFPGLKPGIDFTGGTLIEMAFEAEVPKDGVEAALADFAAEQAVDVGKPFILSTVEGGHIIRIKDITNDQHLALQNAFRKRLGEFTERRFTTIGPTVGRTLKIRSFWAITAAAVVIVLYIAFAFRNIPRKLNPWKFGVVALIALLHDLLITVGFFAFIGMFTSFETDTLFVTALLIILGYSVNDTIVIFDRVRENLFEQNRGEDFALVAERGLHESLARSVNTSLSTLIPLIVLLVLGGESIRWFVLTLVFGFLIGTYSSLFLATPLLVVWRKR